MKEQAVVEYVANCAWQVPLLAAGAWVLVKLARPALRTEYWLWVAVLAMAVVLPLRGVEERDGSEGATFVTIQPASAFTPAAKTVDASSRRGAEKAATVRERVAAIRSGLRGFRLEMSARETHWFVGLYAVALLFAGTRLYAAWRNARRLVRGARETAFSAGAMRSLREMGERMGVAVPEVRESEEIAGPMVVGAFRPVLLLPSSAREYAEEEMRAAVCHELAHVKRHDYLVNLMCEAVMLPVSWHPAASAVERRIQQTREMVCDAMAAEVMDSGEGYARCLVSVTRRIMERPVAYQRTQAVRFFDRNMLEERVMRLTGEDETMAMRSVTVRGAMRVACGGVVLTAIVGVAATCHVRPAFAAVEQSPVAVSNSEAAKASDTQGKLSGQVVAAEPVAVQGVKQAAAPVAIARGKHAQVTAEPGEYVHRWKSADGEPFAMVNREPQEPGAEEQLAVEDTLRDAQKGLMDAEALKLEIPEIKLDMKQLQLGKIQMEKAARLNSVEMKRQLRELSLLDAEKQIAELKLDPLKIDLSGMNLELQLQSAKDAMNDAQVRALLDSKKLMSEAEINADVARAIQGQAAAMAKVQKEMETGELKAKLEAAQKLLEEVQKKMEAIQKKEK